jgi:hypothetical protein
MPDPIVQIAIMVVIAAAIIYWIWEIKHPEE